MREELDAGIRPVLSSDAFVSSLRPLDTISAAMTRRTRTGALIGADHRLTLDEALRAHTLDAATAIGMEDRIGSLQPGKLADVTIVDGQLEATAPERIGDLSIWLTLLDGEIAWRNSAPSFVEPVPGEGNSAPAAGPHSDYHPAGARRFVVTVKGEGDQGDIAPPHATMR
jgi:hypothetical protein